MEYSSPRVKAFVTGAGVINWKYPPHTFIPGAWDNLLREWCPFAVPAWSWFSVDFKNCQEFPTCYLTLSSSSMYWTIYFPTSYCFSFTILHCLIDCSPPLSRHNGSLCSWPLRRSQCVLSSWFHCHLHPSSLQMIWCIDKNISEY